MYQVKDMICLYLYVCKHEKKSFVLQADMFVSLHTNFLFVFPVVLLLLPRIGRHNIVIVIVAILVVTLLE